MKTSGMADKVVLITGASSGIGRATAIHFSSLGSKLVITGRDKAALQSTRNDCKGAADVLQVAGDLAIEKDVERLIDTIIEHYNQLDVLVNNAGIYAENTIETTSLEEYDTVTNINVRSIYYLTMLAVPHLIASKGAIVNVSSVNGLRSFAGGLAYCMSKSALDMFTRCVALELAPKQVRVNSVNPGVIITNIHRRGGRTENEYNAFLDRCKATHALGRVGDGEEVAKAIAFLAGSESSFVTGVQLPVDGGRHAMCPR